LNKQKKPHAKQVETEGSAGGWRAGTGYGYDDEDKEEASFLDMSAQEEKTLARTTADAAVLNQAHALLTRIIPDPEEVPDLPAERQLELLAESLSGSSLVPFLGNFLRLGSVVHMAEHPALAEASLRILTVIASHPCMRSVLQGEGGGGSLCGLLVAAAKTGKAFRKTHKKMPKLKKPVAKVGGQGGGKGAKGKGACKGDTGGKGGKGGKGIPYGLKGLAAFYATAHKSGRGDHPTDQADAVGVEEVMLALVAEGEALLAKEATAAREWNAAGLLTAAARGWLVRAAPAIDCSTPLALVASLERLLGKDPAAWRQVQQEEAPAGTSVDSLSVVAGKGLAAESAVADASSARPGERKSYEAAVSELILDEAELSSEQSLPRFNYFRQWQAQAGRGSTERMARLAHEISSMATSLPSSWDSSCVLRVDEEQPDAMRFAIAGPTGTPYESGVFLFDTVLPENYPQESPQCNLMTTGGGQVRFNPNLYSCGKVCLSLLGTWEGSREESWDPAMSSILQATPIPTPTALLRTVNPNPDRTVAHR